MSERDYPYEAPLVVTVSHSLRDSLTAVVLRDNFKGTRYFFTTENERTSKN